MKQRRASTISKSIEAFENEIEFKLPVLFKAFLLNFGPSLYGGELK